MSDSFLFVAFKSIIVWILSKWKQKKFPFK